MQRRTPDFFRSLYDSSSAAAFDISLESFSLLLLQVEACHPDCAARGREWYESLPIGDLVLAHACTLGNNAAWEQFIAQHKSMLQAAAVVLCRDEFAAHDVVTQLLGDLYGTAVDAAGNRRSKLGSYTGRGTLAAWLRATLAQACIDQHRLRRRLLSLSEVAPAISGTVSLPDVISGGDARLDTAVEQAIQAAPAEWRFLLKAYYFDRMSLTQIGALLGTHESTISRRLSRIARHLRRSVLRTLVEQGMSISAARQTLKSDVRSVSADIEGSLLKAL